MLFIVVSASPPRKLNIVGENRELPFLIFVHKNSCGVPQFCLYGEIKENTYLFIWIQDRENKAKNWIHIFFSFQKQTKKMRPILEMIYNSVIALEE